MNIPQITIQNTKAEIIAAYEELRSLAEKHKETKETPFRTQIISALEKIETEITEKKQETERLKKEIEELKKTLDLGKKIKITEEALDNLQEKITQEEKVWARRKIQLAEELKEEAKFAKKRLEKEIEEKRWEYSLEEKRRREELKEKETDFAKRAFDYVKIKKQVDSFPLVLEKEIAKKTEEEVKKLKKDFTVEKAMLVQENEAEKDLLEQKIESLVLRQKEYQTEIAALQRQLSQASEQIKQLAVAALSSKPAEKEE